MKQTKKPRDAGPFWFDGGPIPVQFCYAPDRAAWDYALKSIAVEPEPYPTASGMCNYFAPELTNKGEITVIITLNEKHIRKRDMQMSQIVGLIAHESAHLMQYAMRHMAAHNEPQRHDELEAYIVHWATQCVVASRFRFLDYKAGLKKNKK